MTKKALHTNQLATRQILIEGIEKKFEEYKTTTESMVTYIWFFSLMVKEAIPVIASQAAQSEEQACLGTDSISLCSVSSLGGNVSR